MTWLWLFPLAYAVLVFFAFAAFILGGAAGD